MRNVISLLLFIFLIISCSNNTKHDYSQPKRVVLAGKINNYPNDGKSLRIGVNRLGFSKEQIYADLDSLGNFHVSFETYIPTDFWVTYRVNFLVLAHPGDSIYVEFDGSYWNRPQVLETIRFSGDAVRENQEAAKFQCLYFSNPLYTDWDAMQRAVKEYNEEEYLAYLDTIKIRGKAIYDQFVDEVDPMVEVKVWAKTYVEENYYDYLSFYPDDHRRMNNLTKMEWNVSEDYFEGLLSRLPIERSMFISAYSISSYINRFHYDYAKRKTFGDESVKQYINVFPDGSYGGSPEVIDSLTIDGIIKYTPDDLLKQMILVEYFVQNLSRNKISSIEDNMDIVEMYITEPFLKEPLLALYLKTKEYIEEPQIATNAILKDVSNSSVSQIFEDILKTNRGKIIYLDVWATWCGSCLSEMPNSKELMKEMSGKDVTFVFICIDSEEHAWKANLSKLQIEGQHYFLNTIQSADIRKRLEINGVPFYMLIDQIGVIRDKGSHIRPSNAKNLINNILDN